MSIIAELIQSKNNKLNGLERQIIAARRKQRGTSDPAYRVELQTTIDQCEEEYECIAAELDVLEQQRLPEKSAEELQKHIVETWELNCHRIDYRQTIDAQMQPVLRRINCYQGGAAVFLIEEGSRMRCKWLLKRLKEWTETQQNSPYIARPLIIQSLENVSALSALAAAFGVETDSTPDKLIGAVAEAIYESASQDSVVIALEMTVKKTSVGTLTNFLDWFLGSVWKTLVGNHPAAAKNCRYVRLVLFVVTDLKLSQLPDHIGVAAPAAAIDRCSLVRVAPWLEEDVVQWLFQFSCLQQVACAAGALRDFGVEAHGVGDNGIPLPTWAHLYELIHSELQCRIEEMKHGKLAAVPVSG